MDVGEAYWALVEPIWERISIYRGAQGFLRQYTAADSTARSLFAAHWFRSEVSNGGLEQFFFNSTGVLAPEAVRSLRRIGMPKTADVASRAMRLFGRAYPRHRARRQRALARLDLAQLERLDDRLFHLFEHEAGGFDAAADRFALARPRG